MHWRRMIEKDYLGAWDLVDDKGKPKEFTVKIASVKSLSVKTRETPKGKRKCVLYFDRARKALIANTTNCETIESLYGPETDNWVGKCITLFVAEVRNPKGGKAIPGIRVSPKKPTGQAEAVEERPVDEGIRAQQDEAFDRGDNADDY